MYDSNSGQSIFSFFRSLREPIRQAFAGKKFSVKGTVVRVSPWEASLFITLAEAHGKESANLTVLAYDNVWVFSDDINVNDEVQISGQISLTKNGTILLIAESIQYVGNGNMPDQLKKWRKEHYELIHRNKKSLPPVCHSIALISNESIHGYGDFCSTLKTGQFDLFSTKMQGANVSEDIALQISEINVRGGYDCIVIVRGGGSPNDLFEYNHPTLLLAIAKSKIPVITGIGHEGDYLLCEEVADVRCSTPTAAAELLNKMASERERQKQVNQYKRWVFILAVILFVILILKIVGK
ncbi:exodeoxyribonuclease VII large subunit [Anaeromusa acidaminophila]|uniref:exodeoxyribonuclease VII large subunit n=1 Tax=Anaeromusa acidaminophila TaxID=81464 RepID=UPI0003636466|nr:exodeoxyribonuclease VII large subunit [Anaeromusa acidaminophila]